MIIGHTTSINKNGGEGAQADWNAVSGDSQILNKPQFFGPFIDFPNLKPVKIVSYSLASGVTDLGTVPAGKRWLYTGTANSQYNATGGDITYSIQQKLSGNYFSMAAPVTASAGLQGPTNIVNNFILEAGQGLSVNTSGAGLALFINVLEFDDTSALKSFKGTLSNGNNTVYTCPSGKLANISGGGLTFSTLGGNMNFFAVFNSSGGLRNFNMHLVPSGQSVSSTYLLRQQAATSNNSVATCVVPPPLSAGDFINVSTNSGTATQFYWGMVQEIDS